jgi:hypothetical protein
MNVGTAIRLCVVAALAGGLLAGASMYATSGNARASGPDREIEPWEPTASHTDDHSCHVQIIDSHVEGSNFCSPNAHASSSSGSGSGDGATTTTVDESEDCAAAGLVTVQACHVVDDNDIIDDVTVQDIANDDTVQTVVTTVVTTGDVLSA